MGACILCGKSAGPFYSLHKSCYSKYDNSNSLIATIISEGLGKDSAAKLASKINAQISECEFVAEAQQRTLSRALEYFAAHHIETTHLSSSQIDSWIDLLEALSPQESWFINQNFLSQQYNVHALQQLKGHRLPESNRHPANYSIKMREQETLWWCFDKCEIQQDKPIENKRQWSVVMQIIESAVRKKQKQTLGRSSLGEGKLLITNQRIYFDSNELKEELMHRDIYSCTPVINGVRLQSKQSTAMPKIFLCEDTRLLFEFIQFAQREHSA